MCLWLRPTAWKTELNNVRLYIAQNSNFSKIGSYFTEKMPAGFPSDVYWLLCLPAAFYESIFVYCVMVIHSAACSHIFYHDILQDVWFVDEAQFRSALISHPYAVHLLWPPRPCLLLPAACVSTDSWEAHTAKRSLISTSLPKNTLFLSGSIAQLGSLSNTLDGCQSCRFGWISLSFE